MVSPYLQAFCAHCSLASEFEIALVGPVSKKASKAAAKTGERQSYVMLETPHVSAADVSV